jgi:colicin import membrane protein
MRSALQRKPEQPQQPAVEPQPPALQSDPLPQPVAEETPPPVPDPAPVEQEKVLRDADSPDVAKVPVEQDAKHKQPDQADLDAKRPTEMDQQKQKQLADIRSQLDKARREADLAEQRAKQIADARASQASSTSQASPPRGNPNADSNRGAMYMAAIRDAVLRQWTRPESVELGQRCRISIRQIPGGEVVSVDIAPSCPYDALGRRSVEAAILKASPLPYAGFEDVFDRNVTLNFVAEER